MEESITWRRPAYNIYKEVNSIKNLKKVGGRSPKFQMRTPAQSAFYFSVLVMEPGPYTH
jgi:hypothetical protein